MFSLSRGKIWIDLDNSPHVPFFRAIIRQLKNRGYSVLITARDRFQVWILHAGKGTGNKWYLPR
ncbi:MAG: DUF354 domain-containing protein [Syntrophales bacterium]